MPSQRSDNLPWLVGFAEDSRIFWVQKKNTGTGNWEYEDDLDEEEEQPVKGNSYEANSTKENTVVRLVHHGFEHFVRDGVGGHDSPAREVT